MGFADRYLDKNNLSADIEKIPVSNLNIVVVIPSYNEPDLLRSLQSLWNCNRPVSSIEVLIVINSPENADLQKLENNLNSKTEAEHWIKNHSEESFNFHIIFKPNLSEKFAGVGLARKIGMDEAAIRFNQINNEKGIILNFDADSVCDKNYLIEIEKHFKKYPGTKGISIYFEHPLSGDFPENIYKAIWLYELHLRYYKLALQYTGFPYYFHTVGSAFAVNVNEYCKQGGMNRQKAGEDFYFLQKIIPLGNFFELNSTRVIPSPRTSDRVPFGTGAAMTKMSAMEDPEFLTYCFKAFQDLKAFIELVDKFYQASADEVRELTNVLPKILIKYLADNNFKEELKRAQDNSAELKSFRKQFFQWFNAFRIIRFLNISHESYYQKNKIAFEAINLLKMIKIDSENNDLLDIYRKLDRDGNAG